MNLSNESSFSGVFSEMTVNLLRYMFVFSEKLTMFVSENMDGDYLGYPLFLKNKKILQVGSEYLPNRILSRARFF